MDALGREKRLDRRLDGNRADAARVGDRRGASGRIKSAALLGNVTGNLMALVKSLGDAGLVGLIALGVILWLFSSRRMA